VVGDVEETYEIMSYIDDATDFWCFDLCDWTAPFGWITSVMDAVDSEYNALIEYPDSSHQSDAIVTASSQYYPSTSAKNYVIPHADSHLAALLSDKVHPQLYDALKAFGAKTQASCPFSVPPEDSFSSNAVTWPFNSTTQAGCLWSALSQAPWITVNTPNGTSSSSINFTVAANPSNTPRTGSINVGNGSSTQSFSIFQGGPCTYALSEGPDVAIPSTGGSSTVNVTTYLNCSWSATSNAPGWLTLSAGAGGTGPGLFTWIASPNAGVGDRSGVINVMGTTLTVIDGSPVGTPGTTTLTFSGAPQSYTFNPCQGQPSPAPSNCPQTIYNGGNITLTILNDSYVWGYGCCTTTGQLAQAFANMINQATDALVTATVSGSTLYLTSVDNGAGTNYSVSVSETFNSPYFSSPAFGVSSSPSATQLIGGTD